MNSPNLSAAARDIVERISTGTVPEDFAFVYRFEDGPESKPSKTLLILPDEADQGYLISGLFSLD